MVNESEHIQHLKDKLLVMLPTRSRPQGFRRALDSYLQNRAHPRSVGSGYGPWYSDIVMTFQNPEVNNLQPNVCIAKERGLGDRYWLVGDIGFVAKVNFLVDKYPGYGAYMILNDDQIIQTKDFDKILMDRLAKKEKESGHRLWILHWKDGINDEKLCQSFCSDQMLELLGSYYPRRCMRHLYSDNLYHFIGENCKILEYCPDVFIEHLHFVNKKAEIDGSYEETNSKERYAIDGDAFGRWLLAYGAETCVKILKKIGYDDLTIQAKEKEITEIIKQAVKLPEQAAQ